MSNYFTGCRCASSGPDMQRFNELRDRFIGTILFPFSNMLMNRKGIMRMYRDYFDSEKLSPELVRELQLWKLRRIVEHAYTWVPYYQKRFKEMRLEPRDIRELEDIKLIPPLSRQDVIEHHREMIDLRQRLFLEKADGSTRGPGGPVPFALFRRHRLVRNTSSGSTGAPTIFYEDGSAAARNWALELRLKSWYGLRPGEREARMARLSTEYYGSGRKRRLRKYFWNQLMLPGINLADRDYAYCLDQIMQFRPKILWGFTSALAGLADYVRRETEEIRLPWLKLIITWAAPLYDHEKRLLKDYLKAPVTNIYGAREVGHIAALCPHGNYHVNQESHLMEIDAGSADAERGEILATTLDASPMPFLRYRMGDIGALSGAACSCGRSLQVLKSIHGRTGEIFTTSDGRMISPNFWCRTFMNDRLAHAVKRFQVIYRKSSVVSIRIIRNGSFTGIRKHICTSISGATSPGICGSSLIT